jgi:hypothetical protein
MSDRPGPTMQPLSRADSHYRDQPVRLALVSPRGVIQSAETVTLTYQSAQPWWFREESNGPAHSCCNHQSQFLLGTKNEPSGPAGSLQGELPRPAALQVARPRRRRRSDEEVCRPPSLIDSDGPTGPHCARSAPLRLARLSRHSEACCCTVLSRLACPAGPVAQVQPGVSR